VIRRVVTIGGPPGSGKSTAGRRVASTLGLEYRSAGELFRAEAARHGLDLEAFGRYAESHPEVDRTLDASMQALAAPGRLLDGRIQGPLCRRSGIPVHSILVTAAEEARIARIVPRDGGTPEETRRKLREREESERTRYLRIYGIELDREPADLTVDATVASAEVVSETIVSFLRSREANQR
jgi:predicted cytidylate kinase